VSVVVYGWEEIKFVPSIFKGSYMFSYIFLNSFSTKIKLYYYLKFILMHTR
jgi:hypothetical protein